MNAKRVENHEKSTPGDSKITQIWCLGYPWEAIKKEIQKAKKDGNVEENDADPIPIELYKAWE